MNKQTKNTDDSQILTSQDGGIRFDIGGLMSEKYSCITTVHASATAPFIISSAIKYGKRYILKSISGNHATTPLYQALLAKEFEIGIGLDHPNIRRTIGFENIEGLGNTLVMEYIDGETLADAIEAGHLHKKEIPGILRQLADALDYLNRKQILHRDLKPSNIMITFSGQQVKLIDFSHSDSEAFVMLKAPAGTNQYIAPELFDGETSPSLKTDMYSFGVIAGQLADLYKDETLLKMANICYDPNPANRPDSFGKIFTTSQEASSSGTMGKLFQSKLLTAILTIILIAIWLYILS